MISSGTSAIRFIRILHQSLSPFRIRSSYSTTVLLQSHRYLPAHLHQSSSYLRYSTHSSTLVLPGTTLSKDCARFLSTMSFTTNNQQPSQGGGSGTKLKMIREMMQAKRLDGYLVPSDDEHGSEYVSAADERRAFISGFTGSAGQALITQDGAWLWTDGRYFLQAGKELKIDQNETDAVKHIYPSSSTTGWTLMKQGLPEVPTPTQFAVSHLARTLQSGSAPIRIGIDPTTLAYWRAVTTEKFFQEANENPNILKTSKEIEAEAKETSNASSNGSSEGQVPTQGPQAVLVPVEENLVDEVWGASKPKRTANPLLILDEKYTGQPFSQKLEEVRKKIAKENAEGLVVSSLDEVAWLFNLRGTDIPFNPVFFSYAVVTATRCTLYLRPESSTPELEAYLSAGSVDIAPYNRFFDDLRAWGKMLNEKKASSESASSNKDEKYDHDKFIKVLARDPKTKVVNCKGKILLSDKASWATAVALGEENVAVKVSPVTEAKAIKNETEVEGFRQSHIRDGAALVRYFAWLEEVLHSGKEINEFDAAAQLEKFRSEGDLFQGLSFTTISSTGANAAIIHYSPDENTSSVIDVNKIYLCDSGAQYLDGTTDTTRTVHFGQPTAEEKRAFTRVLQGHIAIDTAVYPEDTTGYVLDILARKALWEDGLDFGHSTGHGVGAFLNVHEGPHGIGPYPGYDSVPLKEGMTVSNEPGYYQDGDFGIRIENVVIVTKAQTPHNFRGRKFLKFENVTMCPIQSSLVDLSLLSPSERAWLNSYHSEVLQKLTPSLKDKYQDERALKWLERECKSVRTLSCENIAYEME